MTQSDPMTTPDAAAQRAREIAERYLVYLINSDERDGQTSLREDIATALREAVRPLAQDVAACLSWADNTADGDDISFSYEEITRLRDLLARARQSAAAAGTGDGGEEKRT